MDEQLAVEHHPPTGIGAFAARYPFPIDPFQLEAISHLAQGRSVMVAAPTGTGKTLVAEYAIWLAQQRNQRVIYTTPLKALSNQKYRDMRALYGFDAVGLVTGDIVEHSHASIVIMTTEVYRNMLLEEGGDRFAEAESVSLVPSSLADVGFVIFDELHYLSDIGRGPVWEEAIICSPQHVQLVGLSATVSNAVELADWISRVHRPISLVLHEERAVPLEHYYFIDNTLHLVEDANGNRVERFPNTGGEARLAYTRGRKRPFNFDDEDDEYEDEFWQGPNKKRKDFRRKPTSNVGAGVEGGREGELVSAHPNSEQPPERMAPSPGEVLRALRDADLLPCLYFLPGRRVVEEAAMSVVLHLLTTSDERALIKDEVKAWLEHLPQEDRNLQQVHALIELLPRGLAFHHAGLLPGLKVLVETLFARGHLRAVFATDTLSLGINMPARAVVVGSLSKFDGVEMRLLIPNEYRQLTGRAGRRGIDVRGAAVIPYSPWEPFEDSFQRITDELLPVTSSFIIRYNSILNLWRPGDTRHLRRICASSLREYQRYRLWEQQELLRLEKQERHYLKGKQAGKKKGRASVGAGAARGREGELASAQQAMEKRRKQIGAYPLSRAGAAELDGTILSLRTLDYIGPNEQLTLKGRLLRSIFHPSGILIVELIMYGSLDELTAGELAEVCSWFTFDNDRRLNNRHVLNTHLAQIRRELWRIAQRVHSIEEHAGLNLTPGILPDFHGVALSWSRGMSLNGLVRRIDLAEGDLLMLLNQTIDLLQQVQSAVGQVLDAHDLWAQNPPTIPDSYERDGANVILSTAKDLERDGANVILSTAKDLERISKSRPEVVADPDMTDPGEQLSSYHQRLTSLRPLLAQASSSLLRGIVLQSRIVPSMAVQVANEEIPLDSEEDIDPQNIKTGE